MGSGVFFPLCAIPFSLTIIILFYVKGYKSNKETKIYNVLIISNFLGLIIEILCTYASFVYSSARIFSVIVYKAYLFYIILWISTFAYYMFSVTRNELEFDNRRYCLFFVYYLTVFVVLTLLPIELVVKDGFNVRYTSGASVSFAYVISAIAILAILVLLVINMRKLKNKKYIPVFIFLIIGSLAFYIQKRYPQFLMMTYVETLICVIMYFTIENPDVKMVKELEYARKTAERANMAKTDFLSSMSHEIRTPLNAIVGFSNSILEDKTLSDAKEEAKDIIMASCNLLEIVNGILDISKIEAGKMEIVNVNYNFVSMCDDVIKLIRPRIVEKPIDLKVNISKDVPVIVYGDQGKVKEIITNLLTNACKYTESGFISFSVSCVNQKNVSKLVISVEDSGRGIKADKIDKLFTKFNRLEEDKNTTLEGTGLGLAITKSLVEMMNGKIVVQSKYGSGSKFTVFISQKIVSMIEDSSLEEEKVKKKCFDYSNKRLLVVDDNKLNIKVSVRLFRKYKVMLDTCTSGFECLEMVKNNDYDLILLDDMMPKMSGVETLKRLRDVNGFDTPVVVLTANAISGNREKYLRDGFDDYLAKPIDSEELERVLSNYLSD